MAQDFEFTITFDDFDTSLLPPDARVRDSREFVTAVQKIVTDEYSRHGGWATVVVDENARLLRVKWGRGDKPTDALEDAVNRLQRGQYREAIASLELLRHREPDNPVLLYNLGMALSDQGELAGAIRHLQHASQFAPNNANIHVALGVALARNGQVDDAIARLGEAVAVDDANPWAHRNLAGCLARKGRTAEAETHFRRAVELRPDDAAAGVGLWRTLFDLDRHEDADAEFIRAIELDPHGQIGEAAKQGRTRLAQTVFRSKSSGDLRPDAVIYLTGAIEKFDAMTPQQVQAVGMEIAVMGTSGIDTNDSAQKYKLKSLPGQFSGLHLMCLMYTAFKQIAPASDIGFDVAREYQAALALVNTRKRKGGP